jgi:hypothetical protein
VEIQDFESEEFMISEPIGLLLHGFDFVVGSFQEDLWVWGNHNQPGVPGDGGFGLHPAPVAWASFFLGSEPDMLLSGWTSFPHPYRQAHAPISSSFFILIF